MTLKEFFKRLPKDGWRLTITGLIRRGNHSTTYCCPITAAFDPDMPTTAYPLVARRIGLNEFVADRIAEAADGQGMLSPSAARIRRLLLAHCGLTEPTP